MDIDRASVQRLVDKDTIRIQPSFNFALNDISSVRVAVGYSEQSYDDSLPNSTLRDSESTDFSVEYQRSVTERDGLAFSVEYQEFDPDQNLESDSYSASLVWNRLLTPTSTLSVAVGGRRTENDLFEDSGFLFNARYDRRLRSGKVFAVAERRLSASALGNQVESDRFTFGYQTRTSERMSWGVNARYYQIDAISDTQNNNARDFASIEPWLQWQMAQSWRVRLNYRYRWVDQETAADSATSNSIGLALEYAPRTRR